MDSPSYHTFENMIVSVSVPGKKAQWLSESYHRAKTLKRQFDRVWHKNKSTVTRARLRRQIAHCNHLINRDKCNFYKKVVIHHAQDSRRLWQELNKIMHRGNEWKFPPHQSDKLLADRFASFFNDKIFAIVLFPPVHLLSTC